MSRTISALIPCLFVLASTGAFAEGGSFVNFENPQIHPIDVNSTATLLAACNTADNRIELFDISTGTPVATTSIPVGFDPVTVRFRTATEAWVVNHISDSVSIVNTTTGIVTATLQTLDEPCDVVFAGNPQRAFVSCSQVNTIQVFNPANLTTAPQNVAVNGEDPRALAVSPDGTKVYAAIFESGNRTTILGGSSDGSGTITFPPNVVTAAGTPHNRVNPPFNAGTVFDPPKNAANGTPPPVGLIVRQQSDNTWRDDTNANWTNWVSGANATASGRPVGWNMPDNDVAVIQTSNLAVTYAKSLMNLNMAMAINPVSGSITVVGTEATNEIRFEPNVNGTFVRVKYAAVNPSTLAASAIVDLNSHLDYFTTTIPQAQRQRAIGDPRGIVWNSTGAKAYVTGMGSNNVLVINATGARAGITDTIPVQEGPTGLALDNLHGNLYVLNRFNGSISVINFATEVETAVIPFYDPTPQAIKQGRKHLYNTHKTSGLGQVSCGSCHIDARLDRLAWDLGDPSGTKKALDGLNLGANIIGLNGLLKAFEPFHPMKGPMTTQTLQDIIGHEPFHWRGDRLGLEEFNGAFVGLLGDDQLLTATEMQQFKSFLATIHFPPNPFRNQDNTLPTNLPLPGHFKTGRFGGAGQALPNGNAARGLQLYRDANRRLDNGVVACVTCHALPSGNGTDSRWNGSSFTPIAPDPVTGNHHLMLVSIDGSTNVSLKVPQLRNLYDKVGFDMINTSSRAGFGFSQDGAIDSIERFVTEGIFDVANDQEVADLVALMLAFSGSDFTGNAAPVPFEAPGVASQDVHAAVGEQATVTTTTAPAALTALINVVNGSSRLDLIAKANRNGASRGWLYAGSGQYDSDENDGPVFTQAQVLASASATTPVTFTVVPVGSGVRLGLDRDLDTYFDHTEFLDGSDPADPNSFGPQDVECPDLMTQGQGFYDAVDADWNVSDFDDSRISEKFEIAVLQEILCNETHPLHSAAASRLNANRAILDAAPAAWWKPYSDVIAGLATVNSWWSGILPGALSITGALAPLSVGAEEPLSSTGDIDGDNAENAYEYIGVVVAGGGVPQYVTAALSAANVPTITLGCADSNLFDLEGAGFYNQFSISWASADADGDGRPDSVQTTALRNILCNPGHAQYTAANNAYTANLNALRQEAPHSEWMFLFERGITALMTSSQEINDLLKGIFAFTGTYTSITV